MTAAIIQAENYKHKGRIVFILALLLGFIIRLYNSQYYISNPDTPYYFSMASHIIDGTPFSAFPNGFPLLIAGFMTVFGADHLTAALLLANALMSSCVIVLSFLIADRLFGIVVAGMSAAIIALWPNQIHYVRLLLSEVPSTFLLVSAVFLLLRGNLLLSGLVLYAAGFTRATLLPLGPIYVIWLLWHRQGKQAALLLAGFAVGFAIDLALQRAGVLVAASNLGPNLLLAIGSTSTAEIIYSLDGFSTDQIQHPRRAYVEFAARHPLVFAEQRLSALWELWGPWPMVGQQGNVRSTAVRLAIGARFPILLLAAFACWTSARRPELGFLWIPIALVTIIHTLLFSTARFTYPVEPFAIILASAGLWTGVRHLIHVERRIAG
jgi:hypothetical protein